MSTAIYVICKFRMGTAATSSAEAARSSAESAERAARATEASLSIGFEIRVSRGKDGTVWVNPKAIGANVWIHALRLRGFVVSHEADPIPVQETAMRRAGDDSFPYFAHQGESSSMHWPNPPYRVAGKGFAGTGQADYSLTRDGEVRTFHSVPVETRKGLNALLMNTLLMHDFGHALPLKS